MRTAVAFLIGPLALAVIAQYAIGAIFRNLLSWSKLTPPQGADAKKWELATRGHTDGGQLIGYIESVGVYLSIMLLPPESTGYVVAGWLAFKVASKWEVWNNVVQVPVSLGTAVDNLEFLRARRHWADLLYTRFVVGTALNVIAGTLMALLVRELIS